MQISALQWRLQKFCLRGVIKKLKLNFFLIKIEFEYIKLSTKKKKNEVLKFPSTSFQILNCYMIVHY